MKSKEDEYETRTLACIIKYPRKDATPVDEWIAVEGHTDRQAL